MIFSEQQLLSDQQAITTSAASTNYIDLGETGTPHRAAGALKRDIGPGQPVCIETLVTEAFNNLTSLTVEIQVDDNTSFSSPKTVSEATMLAADLVVGANYPHMYLPEGVDERYLRVFYTVTGGSPSLGKIQAGISGGRQTNQ